MSEEITLYVSPGGSDDWSGRLDAPNAEGTDGPIASIGKAGSILRGMKYRGELSGPVKVLIRGGRYELSSPMVFEPADSWPVTYQAYPGEEPVIDGGRRIEGWRVENRDGRTVWVTEIPDVAEGKWYFRQLFVNGERRSRTRLPKTGLYYIEDLPDPDEAKGFSWGIGNNRFKTAPGDIQDWANITDIDIIALHLWIDERLPIASFDPETRIVVSSRQTTTRLRGHGDQPFAAYYVENVKEALSEPGEWYLDRKTGELSYIPMPGEDPETAEVYAPMATHLLVLNGNPDEEKHVEHLRFVGLTFRHTEWYQPSGGGEQWGLPPKDYGNSLQAASHLPGAISFLGARHCAIEDCKIEHIGLYAIELKAGCWGNHVIGNTIRDLGGGGVKIESDGIANIVAPVKRQTGFNKITDNEITAGGRAFLNAVGILCLDSTGNEMSHNHIHDFSYSGISCGWIWGYTQIVARDNKMEKNHIHNLGHGLLSDMGGIYVLGVQPGTVIRGNLIYDIEKMHYGGWAIYLDEGSSHILVENNIGYNVSSQPFHQHYGRENIIRNNILAFGREGQIALSRAEKHNNFTFERNIVLTDGQPVYVGGYKCKLDDCRIISDLNLFWDIKGRQIMCDTEPFEEVWCPLGYDTHSIIADPKFADPLKFDFRLAEDSPAFEIGFRPFDLSDVGPRPRKRG